MSLFDSISSGASWLTDQLPAFASIVTTVREVSNPTEPVPVTTGNLNPVYAAPVNIRQPQTTQDMPNDPTEQPILKMINGLPTPVKWGGGIALSFLVVMAGKKVLA